MKYKKGDIVIWKDRDIDSSRCIVEIIDYKSGRYTIEYIYDYDNLTKYSYLKRKLEENTCLYNNFLAACHGVYVERN